MRCKVACFDLDGTLLRGTTVSLFTAEVLGKDEDLRDLERRYAAYQISNAAIADTSARWFEGIAGEEVQVWMEEAPWIGGIGRTVRTLKNNGLRVLLATVTWRFVADILQEEHGFDATCGTEMERAEGKLTGRVSRHFDEMDKLSFVESYCRKIEVPMSECAAIGDSRSDVPLFEKAGFAIALNATPEARAAADIHLETDDITSVLPIILPR